MEHIFIIATVWLGLAVISAIIAYHLHVSIALIEICVGVIASAAVSFFGKPDVLRKKLKEVTAVGLVGFFAPFIGCAALAYFALGWNYHASLLCCVALSTTSIAVVYAVMLETGFNKTEFGKGILGACFVNDLGTVIALGLLFAPFTYKTEARVQ